MGKTDTNKQWTTYRILDATIDNPDLADPFTVGADGAGKDFILHATANSGKLHWDEDANVLYIIATSIMAYGSTMAISPGGVNAKLSFWGPNDYIQSVGPGYLEIGGSSYIRMASKVVLASTIQLTESVSPTVKGELAYGSDNRLEYCQNPTGPIVFKVPFFNSTLVSNMELPTGVGITLGDKLRLQVSGVAATVLGDLYLHTDSKLTYCAGAGLQYKAVIEDDANKLRMPQSAVAATLNAQLYHNTGTNRLTYALGATPLEVELVWRDITNGRITCNGPVGLVQTNDNYASRGDLWFNLGSGLLRYYDGTTIKTITAT